MNTFTIHEVSQRSPEWHQARLGKLTGSRASDMTATLKSKGEAASRRNLRIQLVLERLTGRSQESGFVSDAMQVGMDREADAVSLYAAMTNQAVQITGFLSHPTLAAGCSLDGHLGDDFEGIIEVKSPQPAAHLEALKTGKIPGDYQTQILHNLWITGAAWCDWFSYNPDFPEPLMAKLVRMTATEAELANYELLVRAFLAEVDREEAEVNQLLTQASTVLPLCV